MTDTKTGKGEEETSDDVFGELLPLSNVQRKMLNAVTSIYTEPVDDINYQHSILCQVGLPRSKVNGTSFERRTKNAILSVEAGKIFDGEKFIQQFVPYGTKARLALGYIHTVAIKTQSAVIPVGDSAREFMQLIGLNSDDGRTYSLVRQQLMALSACKFTFKKVRALGLRQWQRAACTLARRDRIAR